MTVILHTNAVRPALAGDMLISTSGPKINTVLRLPSQPKGIVVPADTFPAYVPVTMRRKVFVVNDNLAVGAAGAVLSIKAFLEDLNDRFWDRPVFHYVEISSFLTDYSSSAMGRTHLRDIGIIKLINAVDRQCHVTGGAIASMHINSSLFGKSVAFGSGATSVIQCMADIDAGRWGFTQPPDADGRFPEFQSLAQNLNLLGYVYWKEFASPTNVFEGWGGAYDLIYQNAHRKYEFLRDYTVVLRLFDGDNPDRGIQLINILKYE